MKTFPSLSFNFFCTTVTCIVVSSWFCIGGVTCDATFTFVGGRGGYVKYPVLNSTAYLHISFEFKSTEAKEQLVLYVDDILSGGKNRGDYMKIIFENGKLHVWRKIESGNVYDKNVVSLGYNLNDNIKHFMEITRSGTSFVITLDGEVKKLSKLKRNVRLNSNVFLGGSPKQKTMSRDTYFNFLDSFVGCISNFQYWSTAEDLNVGRPSLQPIKTSNTTKGCFDRCATGPIHQCRNGGRCKNMYTHTGCDCRGTGYEGDTCQIAKTPIQFFGRQSVIWEPSKPMNKFSTEIFVRFQNHRTSGGVILLINGKSPDNDATGDEYMLLEMHRNAFVFKTRIKGYEEKSFKIPLNNGTSLRSVSIFRIGASSTVVLNDGLYEYINSVKRNQNKLFHAEFTIKDVYVGGGGYDELAKSESQMNFIGCIQDININQHDVIDWIVKKDMFISMGCKAPDPTVSAAPEVTTTATVNTEDRDNNIPPSVKNKEIKKSSVPDDTSSDSTIWIIIGVCIGIALLLALVILIALRAAKKRVERHRKYRDHYLRQTAMRIESEDLLPALTEQKCIREEIAKRKMQTFSPIRKEFYVSPSSEVGGTLPRSLNAEPIYQSHEVFHHAHPCIGKNYAVPALHNHHQQQHPQSNQHYGQQRCQHSPGSSHYGISRKCSHSSIRYQTPNVKTAESVKSFSSQQS